MLDFDLPRPRPGAHEPANRDYTGGFASGLMLKDLRLAQNAATAQGVDTTVGRAAADLYERFVGNDGPRRDFSAIITAIDGTR